MRVNTVTNGHSLPNSQTNAHAMRGKRLSTIMVVRWNRIRKAGPDLGPAYVLCITGAMHPFFPTLLSA